MSEHYILDGKKAVPTDWDGWLKWCVEKKQAGIDYKRVAKSGDPNKVWVSTVFLSINHAYGDGPPLIFETMIFGGEHDQDQDRCSTWDEAEQMHKRMCERAGIQP